MSIYEKFYKLLKVGASQMCKNLDSPHPLTPSPMFGRRGTRILSPLSLHMGEGLGVREKI
jgi:hypothetical protein